jgi:hypothetical protein
MFRRLLILLLVITLFGVLTGAALVDVGYFGILKPHFQSWGAGQVLADLVIMAVLGCIWMVKDARECGLKARPFVALTALAGSFGLLFYLVYRELKSGDQTFVANPRLGGRSTLTPEISRDLTRSALLLVIAAFGALTAMALLRHGYFGIWRLQFQSWGAGQVVADLAILCLFGSLWMIQDARTRGKRVWPFLLLTVAAGSFGPLAYLVVREFGATSTMPSEVNGL